MGESTVATAWHRVFATLYDAAFTLAELRGLREVRRTLVGTATGRVIELGAGTGLNLEHYSRDVSSLLLTEPDPYMAAKLRQRAAGFSPSASVAQSRAEEIPCEDASVDAVISTLVLCTVAEPRLVLDEVARVLRPGGVFLFAEHVRATSPRAAAWQDRLNGLWGLYACGCHCNRDTVALIRDSPLHLRTTREDRLRWISPLTRTLIVGEAVKATT
jgi:ubiquinone/menaquinone biosynthesis C-methylase UbiE